LERFLDYQQKRQGFSHRGTDARSLLHEVLGRGREEGPGGRLERGVGKRKMTCFWSMARIRALRIAVRKTYRFR